MNKFYVIVFAIIILLMPHYLYASVNEDQSDTRENPVIEVSDSIFYYHNYPGYINETANYINLNGADWTELQTLFAESDSCPVNIVHIGDSHLQANFLTAVVRARLSQQIGKLRGRGLITPFKLAGTNEPHDYIFSSTSEFKISRLLKQPWLVNMGFTGIGLSPTSDHFNFSLKTRETFNYLAVYYTGDSINIDSVTHSGNHIPYSTELYDNNIAIDIKDTCYTEITLNISASKGTAIHGINLENNENGIIYHVIGNNGAAFSTYNNILNFGDDLSMLFPDLIILSLGTNESFGLINERDLKKQLNSIITNLKRTNPCAHILLTTPSECQRRLRRRRRRSRFVINENIKTVRNIILTYAKDNSIPVYDWYEVAGGNGSSNKWLTDKTLNKDRIHLTHAGYQLHGNLFADALIKAILKSQTNFDDDN